MNELLSICKQLLNYGCRFRMFEENDKCLYRAGGKRIEFSFSFTTMDEIVFVLKGEKFSVYYNSYLGQLYPMPNIRVKRNFSLLYYIKRLITNKYIINLDQSNDDIFLITALTEWNTIYSDGYTFENFTESIQNKFSAVYNFNINAEINNIEDFSLLKIISFKCAYIPGNVQVMTYCSPMIFDEEEAEIPLEEFKQISTVDELLAKLPPAGVITTYLRCKYIDEFLIAENHV